MDAVKYLKTFHRLCKSQDSCSGCPLLNKEEKDRCCIADISKYSEKSVEIVEQWAKDHPAKTRQSEFLKQYPNAAINKFDGILRIAPCDVEGKRIGCENGKGCNDCRLEYWLAEVTDND